MIPIPENKGVLKVGGLLHELFLVLHLVQPATRLQLQHILCPVHHQRVFPVVKLTVALRQVVLHQLVEVLLLLVDVLEEVPTESEGRLLDAVHHFVKGTVKLPLALLLQHPLHHKLHIPAAPLNNKLIEETLVGHGIGQLRLVELDGCLDAGSGVVLAVQ